MNHGEEKPASARAHGAYWLALALCGACGAATDSGAAARGSRSLAGTPAAGSLATAGKSATLPPSLLPVAGTAALLPAAGSCGKTCRGLQCQQHACPSGSTTISGRVYDPAGRNPLYNVAVYVPNDPLKPLPLGASCDPCESLYSGPSVASALTDANGQFKLEHAPDGANIPLVIQIGKWRRQIILPNVTACQATQVPDKQLTLPRNHKEGDIPSIAISTGAADTLECLLRRVGVDASEYTPGASGDGHIHIFQGNPGLGVTGGMIDAPTTSPLAPRATMDLWGSTAQLMKYDVVLLSCEGQETRSMNQPALHDYAARGGRVFASHFHYAWFNTGPYASEGLASWTTGAQDLGDISGKIVTSFPKGQALQQWLANNKALENGLLPITQARHNADVGPSHSASQAWIEASGSASATGTQYFSFNTPTDAARAPDGKVCGRVVFSDLHVGAASDDNPYDIVPRNCADAELSPQEKALEFMLFDLSACVIPDDKIPEPPPALQ